MQCGTLIGSSPRNFAPPPRNPKLEFTHFYVISHECAKPRKVFIFALTLKWLHNTTWTYISAFFFPQFLDVKVFATLPPKLENLFKTHFKKPKIAKFSNISGKKKANVLLPKNKAPTYIVLTYIYMYYTLT